MSVMVITGGTAGAGKATALRFARAGYHVALIARDETGLQEAQQACERFGIKTLAISADVADAGALQRAAAEVEVMAPRDRGVIIQAGSALAWRSIPLQSAYCGAKAAIRGFTDAVRTELMHEKSHIQLTMVQLPGMNTAQFGWARNKMDQAMQPVPPVYQPEVAAEAIYSVIQRPVNELWVGKSTIQSILGQVFFPRLLDRLMVKKAWEGQFTGQPKPAEHQDDLFTPVRGNHPGHGPFNDGARRKAVTISADLPGKVAAGVGVAVATMALRALFRRSGKRR